MDSRTQAAGSESSRITFCVPLTRSPFSGSRQRNLHTLGRGARSVALAATLAHQRVLVERHR